MKQITYSTTTGELRNMYLGPKYNRFLCQTIRNAIVGGI